MYTNENMVFIPKLLSDISGIQLQPLPMLWQTCNVHNLGKLVVFGFNKKHALYYVYQPWFTLPYMQIICMLPPYS